MVEYIGGKVFNHIKNLVSKDTLNLENLSYGVPQRNVSVGKSLEHQALFEPINQV